MFQPPVILLQPSLILLPNGKVLTIYHDATELYDPRTDTWSKAAPPPASIIYFQSVLLETGSPPPASRAPQGPMTVAVQVTDETGAAPMECEYVWAWVPKKR
jgi:hypothetical protein